MSNIRFAAQLSVYGLVAAIALAACTAEEVVPQGGNPIPTPRTGENVGISPDSQAAATPEETFSRYINDSIAAQVALQQQKINMRQRYQNPDQTLQDLGGLLTEISILEDRTKTSQVNDNNANANVDTDVRIVFADGDTETRVCKYQVVLQSGKNAKGDTVWYVINPDAFPIFVSCTVK